MKHLISLGCILLILAGCDTNAITEPDDSESAVALKQAPLGIVGSTISYDFFQGHRPEGIAFDRPGNLYVGVRQGDASRIDRLTPDGELSTYAMLPPREGDWNYGVLGLVVAPNGTLYAAIPTGNPATAGVYRIDRDGSYERLPGSEGMTTPNALTFDAEGNLYATDSFGPGYVPVVPGECTAPAQCGSIWKYEPGGVMQLWLAHELLDAQPVPGSGILVPGPNGIAFHGEDNVSGLLFVINQSTGNLLRISLDPDGTPGDVVVHAPYTPFLDGIAVDVKGNVYGVNASAGAPGAPPLPPMVKVLTDGTMEAMWLESAYFDQPTSLAFSSGPRSRTSIFYVNAAGYGPFGHGPGVVEVNVGVPGFQTR